MGERDPHATAVEAPAGCVSVRFRRTVSRCAHITARTVHSDQAFLERQIERVERDFRKSNYDEK